MSLGSVPVSFLANQNDSRVQFTLDIFRGSARVGLKQLRAGPVRLDEMVVEVRPLAVPFDLVNLRQQLPDRGSSLATLRAQVSDRHISELFPDRIRLTVLSGRLFLHGAAPSGGRFVIETVVDHDEESPRVSLRVANILLIGCSRPYNLSQLLGIQAPSQDMLVDSSPDGDRIFVEAVRWICGVALAGLGWKVPITPADLRSHPILREGGIFLETSRPPLTPALEVGAEAPAATTQRMAGFRQALYQLTEARLYAHDETIELAVNAAARQIAAEKAEAADLCVGASLFLPPAAILPWSRKHASDFRVRTLTGNAYLLQSDPAAAVENWLAAADQANPVDEPVYALELLNAVLDVLLSSNANRSGYVERAMPILEQLVSRLPDDGSLRALITRLGRDAPFSIRYSSVRAALFGTKPSATAIEQGRELLREAVECGHQEEALELASLIEAHNPSDPHDLQLCAEAMELASCPERAQNLWLRLHQIATIRAMRELELACKIHLIHSQEQREVRGQLVALEEKVSSLPMAMSAWLRRASDHPGLITEARFDVALALIGRKADAGLIQVMRSLLQKQGEAEYRARFANILLENGQIRSEDLCDLDVRRPEEATTRTLVRQLRRWLDDEKTAGSAVWAECQGLMGRILCERYGHMSEARAHLQQAWDAGVRWSGIATSLVDSALALSDWEEAQELLRVQIAAEEDPEIRIEMGRKLVRLIPSADLLQPDILTLLRDACMSVPWEVELRPILGLEVSEVQMAGALEPQEEALTEIRSMIGQGNLEEARIKLDEVLQANPDMPEALLLLAQLQEAIGNPSNAADSLLRRIQWVFDEDEARPLMTHALDLLVASGRSTEACDMYQEWNVMDPDLHHVLSPRLLELVSSMSA